MPLVSKPLASIDLKALDNSRHKALEFVFNHCSVKVAYCDTDLQYRFVNQDYADLFGRDKSEFRGLPISSLFNEESFQINLPKMQRVLAGEDVCFQISLALSDKSVGNFEVHYIPEFDNNHQTTGFYAFIRSIDDALKAIEARDMLHYAVDQSMEGMSIHDKNGRFIYVNPAEAEMYGFSVNELLGQTYEVLYGEEELQRINNEYFPVLIESGKWRGTVDARKKDGSHFYAELSLTTLNDYNGELDGLICTCRDITENKKSVDQLSYLAHYDHLTGLANRVLFEEKVNQLIERTRSNQEKVAVIFLDLDDFKHTNDTLGHSAGDQLILITADRLKQIFP